jgi:hypothetical protein
VGCSISQKILKKGRISCLQNKGRSLQLPKNYQKLRENKHRATPAIQKTSTFPLFFGLFDKNNSQNPIKMLCYLSLFT